MPVGVDNSSLINSSSELTSILKFAIRSTTAGDGIDILPCSVSVIPPPNVGVLQ